jgi:primosomal protein N' (replication factor Y)
VGVVVISDLDALVRRPAMDAPEDALRLSMAIARWAVADPEHRAPVILRTEEPEGPTAQALIRWDPGGFWRDEASRRAVLGFPPARHAVAVVMASTGADDLLRDVVAAAGEARVLGPLPVDHEHQQVLLLDDDRDALLARLRDVRIAASRANRLLRVEVDPVSLG